MPEDSTARFETIPLPDFETLPVSEMEKRAEQFYLEMKRRHTTRHFSDRPVPISIIRDCIRAAATAPSGANHQPWHFVIIGDPAAKAAIRAEAEKVERAFYAGQAGQEWLKALAPLGTDENKPYLETAPWLIAVFAQRRGGPKAGMDLKNYYVNESVGIACGIMVTALHHAGLVALTHTPNPMGFLNRICNRPKSEKPYLLVVTGYPAEGAEIPVHATLKKSFSDIASEL